MLRTEISYWPGFYYYLMTSNLILRLAWTYKLSPHLRHNYATVMFFTLIEAFRRFQWMFVRVEVCLLLSMSCRLPAPLLLPSLHAHLYSPLYE